MGETMVAVTAEAPALPEAPVVATAEAAPEIVAASGAYMPAGASSFYYVVPQVDPAQYAQFYAPQPQPQVHYVGTFVNGVPVHDSVDHSQGKWFAAGEPLPEGFMACAPPECHQAPKTDAAAKASGRGLPEQTKKKLSSKKRS